MLQDHRLFQRAILDSGLPIMESSSRFSEEFVNSTGVRFFGKEYLFDGLKRKILLGYLNKVKMMGG